MGNKKHSKLGKFNYWRKDEEKTSVKPAPNSVDVAIQREESKPFSSQDCVADPCNCTGE